MSNQSTKEKLQIDLIRSMKAGEKDRVDIIRFAQSFIKQLEKDKNIELSESETIQVLKKTIKRNQESFEQFIKAGRTELLDSETKEINIINIFLPKQLNDEETKKICEEAIKSVGASSMKDMGKIMGVLKSKHADTLDFSKVSGIIKGFLNK